MRLTNWIAATATIVIAASSAFASQTTFLYQGSGSSTPASQGWLFPVTIGASASSANGATTLDTTASYSLEDGYSNTNPLSLALVNSSFPTLDPTTGFTVSFDVQLNSESHTTGTVNTNRAGFDVIVLGDNAQGVELGFWSDDIWAQNSGFTHGEDATFNTESASNHYDLTIQGTSYTLYADGTPILTGSTRDYSAEGVPYTLSNYIFIGDDTTEAEASETFSTLSVTVPEPATAFGALMLGTALLTRRRSRKM
jgi:hypothetical protein